MSSQALVFSHLSKKNRQMAIFFNDKLLELTQNWAETPSLYTYREITYLDLYKYSFDRIRSFYLIKFTGAKI